MRDLARRQLEAFGYFIYLTNEANAEQFSPHGAMCRWAGRLGKEHETCRLLRIGS
jgi:hypothetical protein